MGEREIELKIKEERRKRDQKRLEMVVDCGVERTHFVVLQPIEESNWIGRLNRLNIHCTQVLILFDGIFFGSQEKKESNRKPHSDTKNGKN